MARLDLYLNFFEDDAVDDDFIGSRGLTFTAPGSFQGTAPPAGRFRVEVSYSELPVSLGELGDLDAEELACLPP